MLPQWQVKDPCHSAKSAGGRLHLNHVYTPDPMKSEWADYITCAGIVWKPIRKHAQMQLSLLSHCGLILT